MKTSKRSGSICPLSLNFPMISSASDRVFPCLYGRSLPLALRKYRQCPCSGPAPTSRRASAPADNLSVHPFVVAARIFRHILEVLRPGQCFEHLDRQVDVMIDDLTFCGGQRSGSNGQIFDFVALRKSISLPFGRYIQRYFEEICLGRAVHPWDSWPRCRRCKAAGMSRSSSISRIC